MGGQRETSEGGGGKMTPNSSPCDVGAPALRLQGVGKSFGENVILQDITFDLHTKEILGVIGPSGGGKSTLLKCIDLIEFPETGTMEFFGQWALFNNTSGYFVRGVSQGEAAENLTEAHECMIRKKIGLVFQSFNLWEESNVLENLILAPMVVKGINRETAKEQAFDLCCKFGLKDKVQQKVWQLSGGQRQRVAIIRALMMEPEILLLDEVTSALDPLLTFEVLQTIRSLREQGLTMILVTHHMEFASSICDRMMFLSHGKIVQLDSPDMLRSNPATDEVGRYLEVLRAAS